jgi:hypothetical protein
MAKKQKIFKLRINAEVTLRDIIRLLDSDEITRDLVYYYLQEKYHKKDWQIILSYNQIDAAYKSGVLEKHPIDEYLPDDDYSFDRR